jgi:HK97 family phage major capsid protein
MTVNELRDKRGKAIADARAILDTAGEKGLSAEDAAKYDAFMADAAALKTQIGRVEQQEAIEAEERSRVPVQISAAPAPVAAIKPTATDEYRDIFWRQLRRGGPETLEFAERRALSVGTDTAGGYLVPDAYQRELIMALDEPVIMRRLARVIGGVSTNLEIPVVSSHGSAYWTGENQAFTESDETFAAKRFHANKLTCLVKVSQELVDDSAFPIEAYIRDEFARRIGAAEDAAYIAGTGVGQPLGFTAGGTSGLTAAASTSITADELIRLKHALSIQYRGRAQWFMADGTVSIISRLKTGDGQYLWQPGLVAGTQDMLLGRPVNVSSNVPAMTSGLKAVWFGDPSYYVIVDRAGVYIQVLRELYAVNGQVAFLAYLRTDGRLVLDAAMYYVTMA